MVLIVPWGWQQQHKLFIQLCVLVKNVLKKSKRTELWYSILIVLRQKFSLGILRLHVLRENKKSDIDNITTCFTQRYLGTDIIKIGEAYLHKGVSFFVRCFLCGRFQGSKPIRLQKRSAPELWNFEDSWKTFLAAATYIHFLPQKSCLWGNPWFPLCQTCRPELSPTHYHLDQKWTQYGPKMDPNMDRRMTKWNFDLWKRSSGKDDLPMKQIRDSATTGSVW